MNIELELTKRLATMTLQQKQAVLAFVKFMGEQFSTPKEKISSTLSNPQTEAEKEIAWLIAHTDKGKPEQLLKYAGTLSSEDADDIMAAINDPIYGCNKMVYKY